MAALCLAKPIRADTAANDSRDEASQQRASQWDGSAFARFVPPDVNLFATVRRISDADTVLRRAHAWSLAPLLSGGSLASRGELNLSGIVCELLALDSAKHGRDIADLEFGVMAKSWGDLAHPVWLLRLPNEKLLKRWFPTASRVQSGTSGRAHFFRLRNGLMVGVRDGVIAFGKKWGPSSLLDRVISLMAGPGGLTLEHNSDFRAMRRHLPAHPLAVVYAARGEDAPNGMSEISLLLPALQRSVIGLYESGGRLDFMIQGIPLQAQRKPRLGRSAVERLLQLPQTTLLATATTLDLREKVRSTAIGLPQRAWVRYISLLAAFATTETDEPLRLGPHLLLAWGQDLGSAGTTPQVALLVECDEDEAAVRRRGHVVAERIVRLIRALEGGEAGKLLKVEQSRHLGVPVEHLPFGEFARASRFPFAKVLQDLDPAWALRQGWLIVALTREHLEQVLDAQFGLLPNLGTVPDASDLPREAVVRSAVSLIQPALATKVLEGWLAAHGRGEPSWLDAQTWGQSGQGRSPLGIGMKIAQEPGAVVVERIYAGTMADQRLQVGDRLVGFNGQLLALDSPNADLRRRWADQPSGGARTFRVLRDGQFDDVVFPVNPEPSRHSSPSVNLVEAVRELASLGRTLEIVSFAVNASDGRDYSARLSLRFAADSQEGKGRPTKNR